MKKLVISGTLAIVAVFALLGSASASVSSSTLLKAASAVNMQIDTISFDVAASCGCAKKDCGCAKPKCGCEKKSCGCEKPKCGCEKPKCGCEKPKCGCEKKSCGCKDKCECCPKQVENYPDANRGAEGEWARDGLSRQRA